MKEDVDTELRTSYGNEFHCVGPVKEKARCPKGLCFCERYAEGSGVRNGAKLSGWTVDSQEFRKIDCVSFNERIVAQSCDIFTGFLRLLVASEVSEGGV